MELAGIIRVLRRRWFVVCLGALAAVAAGIYSGYSVSLSPPGLESRETTAASASTQLFVDTPSSLISEAQPAGHDTIVARAELLGSLMASRDISAEIARDAGLRPAEVAVVAPKLGDDETLTALSRAALEVVKPVEPNVVTVTVPPLTPILSIVAEAPDAETAARLTASATAAVLSLAPEPASVGNRAVRVEQLGPAEIEKTASGRGPKTALVVAVGLFGLWCSAVVVFDGVARRRTSFPALVNGQRA